MLNKDFYKKEILDIACKGSTVALKNGMPIACRETCCDECEFNVKDCNESIHEWANAEYKEPKVDWSNVEVDTKVLVRDYVDGEWTKRYFAKYKDGNVYTFDNGTTSWTVTSELYCTSWIYVKLAEED